MRNTKFDGFLFGDQTSILTVLIKPQIAPILKVVFNTIHCQKPKVKLIFHSDQGIEYFANDFRAILKENNITQSMSRRGCCWDNAYMESFFHSLKTEMVYFQNFKHLEQAVAYIIDYITFYNDKRIHSGLDYLTPKEFEKWAA